MVVQGAVIVGREGELAALAQLVEEVRRGGSASLALVGGAGSGKTTLLAEAERMALAGDSPLLLMRARGIESEAELAFSGLLDLLRPHLGHLETLPGPQAEALRSALALGPAAGVDRFAVAAATLGLVTAVAAEQPLLVVLEDLQWIDPPTREAVTFATRRLYREGVGVLAAVRADGPVVDLAGIEQLVLPPLTAEQLGVLAERAGGAELPSEAAANLLAVTGGNPLAALTVLDVMGPAELAALDPSATPVPVADRISDAVLHRLDGMDPAARHALIMASAAGTTAPLTWLQDALESQGGVGLLEESERRGVVSLAGALVEFEHPLARSAVYQSAGAAERRAAHRALAGAAPPGAPERAWHLSAAALGPDEEAAAALDGLAEDAAGRGAPGTAARARERAAELSTDPADRSRRLAAAARSARLVDTAGALRLVRAAIDAAPDPRTRADAIAARCEIDSWRTPIAELRETLSEEADRVEEVDRRLAARMRADAAVLSLRAADVIAGMELVQAARTDAPDDPRVEWVATVAEVLAGNARAVRDDLLRMAGRLTEDPWGVPVTMLQFLPRALFWIEEYDAARALADRVVEMGRARSPALLPFALATRGELDFRTGRWATSLAASTESVALAAEFDQPTAEAFALAGLARLQACTGRDADARESAARARSLGEGVGSVMPIAYFGAPALGLLELGRRRAEAAVAAMEEASRSLAAGGLAEPGMVQVDQNLAEAYARAGRARDALEVIERVLPSATLNRRLVTTAVLERTRGLITTESGEAERAFARARAAIDAIESPFEQARTHLAYGEWLRRERRRAEAREEIESALEAFRRLGARPWEEIAVAELEASGRRAHRREDPASALLTPRELQLALVVAEGATNKEAAQRLFLSEKTVEAHLARIYRKAGVRSRTELAALATRDGLPVATGS